MVAMNELSTRLEGGQLTSVPSTPTPPLSAHPAHSVRETVQGICCHTICAPVPPAPRAPAPPVAPAPAPPEAPPRPVGPPRLPPQPLTAATGPTVERRPSTNTRTRPD